MSLYSFIIFVLIAFWTTTHPVRAEEGFHIPFEPNTGTSKPVRTGSTPTKCWHSSLMKISELMLNDPDALSDFTPERDGKIFRRLENVWASGEMMKGSRMETYQSEDGCEIVIAFRGTAKESSKIDLLQDLNFVPTKDSPDHHPGFADVANSYKRNIKKVVADAKKKCGRESVKTTLTGHSLGGAVAYSVANVVSGLELGEVELVLFGSPRVMTKGSTRTQKVKPIHYFVNQDPIVLVPPAMFFKELTDEMYQFEQVSYLEPAKSTAFELVNNHLPRWYRSKMEKWCEGGDAPELVHRFTHNLRTYGIDASGRLLRSIVDGAGNAILPSTGKNGEKLPPITQSFNKAWSKSNRANTQSVYLNSGDGKSAANKLACSVKSLMSTPTQAGRGYYCNSDKSINDKATQGCHKACMTTKGLSEDCYQACNDRFLQFCLEKLTCQGKTLSSLLF